MDFEIVVGWEEGDGGVEGGIVEDGIGDLILDKTLRRRLSIAVANLERRNRSVLVSRLLLWFHRREINGSDPRRVFLLLGF